MAAIAEGTGAAASLLTIRTELGDIRLATRPDAAPKTLAHVVALAAAGLYDGCCFYRSDFVIQMGLTRHVDGAKVSNSVCSDLDENETGSHAFVSNTRGTMAVAHWDVPDCGNSEVFINLGANTHLDSAYGGYCVFAQIAAEDRASFETVDKIAAAIAAQEGRRVAILSVRASQ